MTNSQHKCVQPKKHWSTDAVTAWQAKLWQKKVVFFCVSFKVLRTKLSKLTAAAYPSNVIKVKK